MTPRERVWAALHGEAVDRPPISFWGHVYHRESSAEDLVETTLESQVRHRWDWIKLNPRKHYHVEPWGVRYRYSGQNHKPKLEAWPVSKAADWALITPRPPDEGALGEQLHAFRMLRKELLDDVPLIQTVFAPLAILGELVETPDVLRSHLDSEPDRVLPALEAVTQTFEKHVRQIAESGADGIFFATVDWGTRDMISAEELSRWSRPFDLRILSAVDRLPFNVLHVCKANNLLFEFADYPVSAFSWAATDPSNPTLARAMTQLKGAVMGGISQEGALQAASPHAVLAEFRRAFEQTGGRRWLVAPGCSIPPNTPTANLEALRQAVEGTRLAQASPGNPTRRDRGDIT